MFLVKFKYIRFSIESSNEKTASRRNSRGIPSYCLQELIHSFIWQMIKSMLLYSMASPGIDRGYTIKMQLNLWIPGVTGREVTCTNKHVNIQLQVQWNKMNQGKEWWVPEKKMVRQSFPQVTIDHKAKRTGICIKETCRGRVFQLREQKVQVRYRLLDKRVNLSDLSVKYNQTVCVVFGVPLGNDLYFESDIFMGAHPSTPASHSAFRLKPCCMT